MKTAKQSQPLAAALPSWKVQQPEPARFPSYRVVDADGRLVANVPIMAQGDASMAAILMAAAPDLLQACSTLLADFTSEKTHEALRNGPHVQLLRGVIAKAEGRS